MAPSSTIRSRSRVRKLLLVGCTAFVALLLLELALHGLCLASARVDRLLGSTYWRSPYPPVADARLGFRGNPQDPDYDRRGFRNAAALDAATLVVLGDSQTQGQNATRAEAYPQQIAATTGLSVYNMSFGGYCPLHALLLVDDALALKPEVVVFGIYGGNDVYECYEMVYEKDRLPELKSTDAAVLQTIRELNAKGLIDDQINKSFYGNEQSELRKFLSEWSKTYALLRAVKDKIVFRDDWAKQKRQVQAYRMNMVVESPEAKTILTPQYRMNAIDRSDPRIQAGKQVAWEAIRRIHDRIAQHGVKFLLLLIPTKELVFKELVDRDAPHSDPEYDRLIESETEFWGQTKARLHEQGIEWVDALPAMQRTLMEKKSPYSANPDGHPNAVGYRAIADAVVAALRERGWIGTAAPQAPR